MEQEAEEDHRGNYCLQNSYGMRDYCYSISFSSLRFFFFLSNFQVKVA